MAFQSKKITPSVPIEDSKAAPAPEKKIPAVEQAEPVIQEMEKNPEVFVEKKEISKDERIIAAELRKEIEMMQLDDKTKAEAEKKAEKIEFLGEKEKIEHLLEIARKKGLIYAIQVARKMNEPYLLDILHDTLASEGYYKDFINKK
jgi:hypothetical protein